MELEGREVVGGAAMCARVGAVGDHIRSGRNGWGGRRRTAPTRCHTWHGHVLGDSDVRSTRASVEQVVKCILLVYRIGL
jgi:hypothetical protein